MAASRSILALVLATALSALAAPAAAQIKVVASFSILADMAARVGGDRVVIATLVGADTDGHSYEPKPADLRIIASADLVVANGLGFEPWLDRLIRASGYAGTVVAASEGAKLRRLGNAADRGARRDAQTLPDPHAWQDLANARIYVGNIAAALTRADPAGAGDYAAAAAAYRAEITDLDAWARREIAAVPPNKRNVISSHDAFGYFAEAYGVNFLSPAGLSTAREPSAREVANLIRQIRRDGVRALFVENIADGGLTARVIAEAGGTIGGALYADALSGPNGPAPTFLGMVRHNTTALVRAMARN